MIDYAELKGLFDVMAERGMLSDITEWCEWLRLHVENLNRLKAFQSF